MEAQEFEEVKSVRRSTEMFDGNRLSWSNFSLLRSLYNSVAFLNNTQEFHPNVSEIFLQLRNVQKMINISKK